MPLIALLRAHWPLALAALVGAAAAWLLKPNPQPKVHEVVTASSTMNTAAQVDTKTAWEKITYTDFGWAPPVLPVAGDHDPAPAPDSFCRPIVTPGEDRIIHQVVVERGPTEVHAAAEQHVEEAQRLDLTIAPAQAGWALQVGLEDVLRAKTLRLAARRRLFGPIWVELAAVPAGLRLGVAAAVEF